ncbi:MAG TPA: class I SAM-dependent methyltransferase [Solirubrobacteraceae bacterium]|jgi:SAM-dependent methyltransferase|nr:class I SAM-dependent methyltransferase [Solirubrobacteraceae bacterium]
MTSLAAIELYGRTLVEPAPGATTVRSRDGRAWALPLQRYLGPLAVADEDVLSRASPPVLDVGCGPGRHVLALARRGRLALGVDVSSVAVRIARERGAIVHQASVFDHIPGAGTWGSALLLDGNIGIGGRPTALLARLGRLLRPGGAVLVELEGGGAPSGSTRIRLEAGDAVSDWFRWAHVGIDAIGEHADAAGLAVREVWEVEGRWFACLVL